MLLLALSSLVFTQDAFADVTATRKAALAAEASMDWQTAFNDWQRLLDRAEPSEAIRFEAVAHVHDLNTKIPPENTDPKKARSWPTLVVLFKNMDVNWKDKQGQSHHFTSNLNDADIATIHKAFETYRTYVFRYTNGILRVDPEFHVIEEPITKLEGDTGFWVGPGIAKPVVLHLMGSRKFQSVFTYEKFHEGDQTLPAAFAGGTYGGDQGLNGAAFSEIAWDQRRASDGEVELHEWLHEIDWMFTTILGYPQAASINPDNGRQIGEQGGDEDFRRPKMDFNWMDFYVHIMQDHVTRRMWHEATMTIPAPNPWLTRRAGR